MGKLQTAVVQSWSTSGSGLPLAISDTVSLPEISSPYHVLIRILAVGLNPTDYKMTTLFHMEHNAVGCDFCGIVERSGSSASLSEGTRVCGAVFPYRPGNRDNGAFSQWVVADSRHLLRVPNDWEDTEAAALGAVGWSTVFCALSDLEALGLELRQGKFAETSIPVLVYGGGTATGLMAIQILKIAGYSPISVCSSKSAPLALKYGAMGTVPYTSDKSVDEIKALAGSTPIRHALDCITDAESAATCFAALGRTGGRYACLEDIQDSWRSRRAVKVKVVMGYEMEGEDVDLGANVYTRKARPELHALGIGWTKDMQQWLDAGTVLKPQTRELGDGFQAIIDGLHKLQSGGIQGGKMVVSLRDG